MPAKKFLFISALCYLASASSIKYYGTLTNFNTQVEETNTNVIRGLYDDCSVVDTTSGASSTGSVCMAQLISYMLQAMATVADGSCNVGTVNSTTNGMVTDAASRKRHTSSDKRTLQALSDRWTSGSHGRGELRVMDAIYSHIHPGDGLAFRTNIHSENATLFVHTNGKNATAQFDDDSRMDSRKRGTLDTAGHHFRFPGAQGVKLEAQGMQNNKARDYLADLVAFAYGFAYGNGDSPAFQQGDSWAYVLCDASINIPLFFGRVVAEVRQFESNFEPVQALSCD